MSTRSLINVACTDGKVRSIYVHFDGYAHLETLEQHYNSQEQAELLVSLGDLSSLGERASPKMGENHSFDHPIEGVCVAYGRDRGEDDCAAAEFDSLKAARKQDRGQEYLYEWDGKWSKLRARS